MSEKAGGSQSRNKGQSFKLNTFRIPCETPGAFHSFSDFVVTSGSVVMDQPNGPGI